MVAVTKSRARVQWLQSVTIVLLTAAVAVLFWHPAPYVPAKRYDCGLVSKYRLDLPRVPSDLELRARMIDRMCEPSRATHDFARCRTALLQITRDLQSLTYRTRSAR